MSLITHKIANTKKNIFTFRIISLIIFIHLYIKYIKKALIVNTKKALKNKKKMKSLPDCISD